MVDNKQVVRSMSGVVHNMLGVGHNIPGVVRSKDETTSRR